MKKLFGVFLLIVLSLASIFSWQVWQNNRNTSPVSHSDLSRHFQRSVSWLDSNYVSVENTRNPILWWMVHQAALTSGNDTLKNIYSRYKKDHLDSQPPNLSTPMFDKFYHPRMPDISQLSAIKDYQILMFYGISCDAGLASEPVVQRQLVSGFCSLHYLRPRCITHQLMGLRFIQRYQCGHDDVVQSTIIDLQRIIVSELTLDFRVSDAYIQRVLMLVDSGAYDAVKAVWIKNILAAQNEDGSWDDLDPIVSLGENKVLGYTSKLLAVRTPKADFHTTAQAIWLLSLLLEKVGSN